jgi:hypothetical protein
MRWPYALVARRESETSKKLWRCCWRAAIVGAQGWCGDCYGRARLPRGAQAARARAPPGRCAARRGIGGRAARGGAGRLGRARRRVGLLLALLLASILRVQRAGSQGRVHGRSLLLSFALRIRRPSPRHRLRGIGVPRDPHGFRGFPLPGLDPDASTADGAAARRHGGEASNGAAVGMSMGLDRIGEATEGEAMPVDVGRVGKGRGGGPGRVDDGRRRCEVQQRGGRQGRCSGDVGGASRIGEATVGEATPVDAAETGVGHSPTKSKAERVPHREGRWARWERGWLEAERTSSGGQEGEVGLWEGGWWEDKNVGRVDQ